MSKKALITGITGQDGSYLAEHLSSSVTRCMASCAAWRWKSPSAVRPDRAPARRVTSASGEPGELSQYISHRQPREFDECYHLAAQSFVAESFADGFSTMNTNINGTHYMLAALRELRPKCRFYFAARVRCSARCAKCRRRENHASIPAALTG